VVSIGSKVSTITARLAGVASPAGRKEAEPEHDKAFGEEDELRRLVVVAKMSVAKDNEVQAVGAKASLSPLPTQV
jgi:hypothetical protein